MGVLPLQFKEGDTWESLGLTGDEEVTIHNVDQITPRANVTASVKFANGDTKDVELLVRIDTADELDYFRNGGILHYVIRKLAA